MIIKDERSFEEGAKKMGDTNMRCLNSRGGDTAYRRDEVFCGRRLAVPVRILHLDRLFERRVFSSAGRYCCLLFCYRGILILTSSSLRLGLSDGRAWSLVHLCEAPLEWVRNGTGGQGMDWRTETFYLGGRLGRQAMHSYMPHILVQVLCLDSTYIEKGWKQMCFC